MDMFIGMIMLAIVVEGMITYFKTLVMNGKLQWQIITSIVLGVLLTVAYNVDLLSVVGFTSQVPFVGSVVTGVLISRGSNYIFDLVGQLTAIRTQV